MGFTRRVEDFVCEQCGMHVCGNGYTNHCPQCLWSKHVDISPGDRAQVCRGPMKPVALEGTSARYRIVHACVRCGEIRRVDSAPDDYPDALIALAENGGTMHP